MLGGVSNKVSWKHNPVRFVVRVKPTAATQTNQQRQLPLSVIKPAQTDLPTIAKLENYEVPCDEVLESSASHETVFKQAEGMVRQFMRGKNCTVVAYGASGSGKTHMILGDSFYDDLHLQDSQDYSGSKSPHNKNKQRVAPATTPKKNRMGQH